MAVGAEVGGHGFDRREVDNAVSGMGFFASPPCPHAPAFFYVPRAAASAAASTERDVTFACNGDYGAVAGTPAPPTKRAREEGRLRFPGADGRAKKRKVDVDPVVNPPRVGVAAVNLGRWQSQAPAEAAELERRWRLGRRRLAALLKAYLDAARQAALKSSAEEVERARGLSRALEAKLRDARAQALAWRGAAASSQARALEWCGAALSSQAEALAWRGVALSSRAEATALRADLERALRQPPPPPPRPPAEPSDAESCCYGDNGHGDVGVIEENVGRSM